MKKLLFPLAFLLIFSFATAVAAASGIEAEDTELYAADGISVSVTDATEPVDISACAASASGSPVPPVYDEIPDYSIDYVADGVSVSVTNATEPVDISACATSVGGSPVPPVCEP